MKTPTQPELEQAAEVADLLASLTADAATDPKARAFLLTYAPWASAELARMVKA